ncbi:PhoH family protein [bacterium]|nr:PhoH family protein [bacterium]|tara:strand:+ start:37849 stop:38805 length:957 start_codon:yes stop_codon:yes gene_type:complete
MSVILNPVSDEKLVFDNVESLKLLVGPKQSNIFELEKLLNIKIHSKGNELNLSGPKDETDLGKNILQAFYGMISKGYSPAENDFKSGLKIILDKNHTIEEIFLDTICVTTDRKTIAPKSINQKIYIDSIRKNDIVFGIGPAGTGKTYLAVATAVASLNLKKVKKIILTRPAVEAGEKLGFLPGDLSEKVDPYLKPLFDALNDMLDFDTVSRLIEREKIEIAPLAFMRGRTLNDSFIILDEAQNSTSSQMKMFLTRIGFNSKCIITGDVTQIDLDKNLKSGLVEAQSILKDINGINFCSFDQSDVVRHRLVKEIIEAYK